MAQNTPLLLRILASSVTAANRAGKIIRDIMNQGELGIVEKGKNDLQTEADRAAQRCIIASLSRQFPSATIIGEEGPITTPVEAPSEWLSSVGDPTLLNLICPDIYKTVLENEIVIWVDPLDGTSEYTQGLLEHVTVLIGIAVNGEAIAGVIHQPYGPPDNKGRCIWGLKGAGVGGFVSKPPPKDRFIIATTRSHSNKLVQEALDALKPDDILRVGGAGHKVLLLMEGKAHSYVFASAGCKKWDTCAPEAVLYALGGKLTDMHGNNYCYNADVQHVNSAGVFATAPGQDHSKLLECIPSSIKQMLI